MNRATLFKEDVGCKGTSIIQQCRLVRVTLEYHVVVINATIALDERYMYEDHKVVTYYESLPGSRGPNPCIHGGMHMALRDTADLRVSVSVNGTVG